MNVALVDLGRTEESIGHKENSSPPESPVAKRQGAQIYTMRKY